MKELKKMEAFTMVELIAIIVILVLIVIVALPNLLGTRERQIEREFNNFLNNLFIAAENHLTNDRDLLELLNYHNRLCITIGELREEGLISGTATNPRDDVDVEDYHFVIIRVKDDGSFEYDYIIDGSDCLPTGTLVFNALSNLPIRNNQIESIETRNRIEVDISTPGNWRDVSVEQNNSVIAWWEPGEEPDLYKVYIGSNGMVIAHSNTGGSLFSNLTNATHLDLTHLDTSNVTRMSSMFALTGVSSIEFGPNFITDNVTSMSTMFFIMPNLTEIRTPDGINVINWDTKNVTDMGGMFYETRLSHIEFGSNFVTDNVTSINGMFWGMRNLTEIRTPAGINVINWDTRNVTNMRLMFESTRLSHIEFGSNFVTNNVTNMGMMFGNMSNLTEIRTPAGTNVINWDTRNVTTMEFMFSSIRLSSLEFGSNFVTNNVTNMEMMFSGMRNLNNTQGLNIRHFNFNNVTNRDSMFSQTPTNARLTVNQAGNTWLNNNGFSAWNNRVVVP